MNDKKTYQKTKGIRPMEIVPQKGIKMMLNRPLTRVKWEKIIATQSAPRYYYNLIMSKLDNTCINKCINLTHFYLKSIVNNFFIVNA